MTVNYKFKTKPYAHQVTALDRSMDRKEYAFFAEMGCVDADTEYLSPTGWRRIADYDGGKVAQFNLDGIAEFVEPINYIKLPCETMLHFTSARGLDQMLSDEHRMLLLRPEVTRNPRPTDMHWHRTGQLGPAQVHQHESEWVEGRAADVVDHGTGYSHVWPCFIGCDGEGVGLTPEEIRVQVAFHADGTYNTRDLSTIGPNRKGYISIKRQRKKDRLRQLLENAGIPYTEKERDNGFSVFGFLPPVQSKTFVDESRWWQATSDEKAVIADEVFHWDSKETVEGNRGQSYSSMHKCDADFIQFCLVSQGKRATVRRRSDGTWAVNATGTGRTSNLVVCKHNAERVPTPDGCKYCFEVPSSYLVLRRNGCVFTTGNSGKTKMLLDTISNLYLRGEIDFALVIAPKGVYRNWTNKEIPDHFPDDVPHRVIRWVSSPNKKQQEEMRSIRKGFDGLTIFVMNVEAFSTIKGKGAGEWMAKNLGPRGLIGIDESTTIKNHKAKRTKALIKIAAEFKYKRIMTGSPITKEPMDIYSQAAFLGPRTLGYSSYYAFQGRYAVTQKRTMGAHSFQQIVGYRNLDELTQKIDTFSYRVLKEDCLDLPEKTFTARYVTLTKEQRQMYDQLRQEGFLMLDEGDMVSTPQIITLMLRLQQVVSGHLMSDDGELITFPSGRIDALKEVAAETTGKIVIFARFRHSIQQIQEALESEYGEGSVVTYFGDTTVEARELAVKNFQDPAVNPRFFVTNKTGAYGITLTEASTMVFYESDFSLEVRLQAQDRVHRIGQKNPVTYVDLIAEGTIDEKIVENLRNKIDMSAKVLGEEAREWLNLKPKTK